MRHRGGNPFARVKACLQFANQYQQAAIAERGPCLQVEPNRPSSNSPSSNHPNSAVSPRSVADEPQRPGHHVGNETETRLPDERKRAVAFPLHIAERITGGKAEGDQRVPA